MNTYVIDASVAEKITEKYRLAGIVILL